MTLTTGGLLGVALAAIAVLLFLIIVFKVNATVALILVSALTAIATGVPVNELFDMLLTGFSGTVGNSLSSSGSEQLLDACSNNPGALKYSPKPCCVGSEKNEHL